MDLNVEQQASAFLSWLNSLDLPSQDHSTTSASFGTIEAFYHPNLLLQVLQLIDDSHFHLKIDGGDQANDPEEPLDSQERLERLEDLYAQIQSFLTETLRLSMTQLPKPDLVAVSKQDGLKELCSILGLALFLAVMGPSKGDQVVKIQSSPEWVQRELMLSIETIRGKLSSPDPSGDFASSSFRFKDASPLNDLTSSSAHAALQQAYQTLQREHAQLQSEHEDAVHALSEAEASNARAKGERHGNSGGDRDRLEASLRSEIDSLRSELSRTEAVLAEQEDSTSRHEARVQDLTRQVEELSGKAEEAEKLADQMDEYRHAAEKARKLESTIEKYKKKLEESAEARREHKQLQEQNVSLLEQNEKLEEENNRILSTQPLLEQYKVDIGKLETKNDQLVREREAISVRLQQTEQKLQTTNEAQSTEAETIGLLENKIRELEMAGRRSLKSNAEKVGAGNGASGSIGQPHSSDDEDETDGDISGIANEMEDAVTGRTTTDLKLQIRKLQRELASAKTSKAEASRVVVLENLLEDSQRLKARYEKDYLDEHRAKLVLQSQMEDIRSGRTSDEKEAGEVSQEVVMALRMRLNETADAYEALRKDHLQAEQRLQDSSRQLAIAKSDLALVDKDQIDILAALREKVAEEKVHMATELDDLRNEISELKDKGSMQLSQINTLLMDKVTLQSDGLTQREKMLEREQQRRNGDEVLLPSSSTGMSEKDKAEFERLRAEAIATKGELDEVKEKLMKARNFTRQQDRLFKKQQAALQAETAQNPNKAVEATYLERIDALSADVDRLRALNDELEQRYQREQSLMLSAWQEVGMQNARSQMIDREAGQRERVAPKSWIAQQRAKALLRPTAN